MNHLLIVDAHAVLHRAYHSIPPLTSNGQPVNAIYGFYSMLLSAVDQLKPDYLIVALDSPGPTFRQSEFIGYRAKRKVPDRDLISQLPLLPDTLSQAQISSFAMGGYEADDLIATIVKKSLKKVHPKTKKRFVSQITIITGDKDLMQLVGDQVSLFMPIRGLSESSLYGPKEVQERLGVSPSQVIDLKALMGDSSDNYPGIEGVGPKAATDLLGQFQTLDNIYSHLFDIKGSLRDKLISGKESAYMSQRLATLIDNIPISFTLASARWNSSRARQLIPVFESFNFRSLISRLKKKYHQKLISKKQNSSGQTSLF
ncbi:MAG: 5'-3' exonuclease H3TH domain-containing protein [Candidatus Shapirobacteria bacterium]|jgi:DNA polymerase-1